MKDIVRVRIYFNREVMVLCEDSLSDVEAQAAALALINIDGTQAQTLERFHTTRTTPAGTIAFEISSVSEG